MVLNFKNLYILICVLLSIAILIPNRNLYLAVAEQQSGAVSQRILNQLRYLEQVIPNGGAERMQQMFPEGAFFLHALYTLSWIQVAHRVKNKNREFATAIQRAQTGLTAMEKEIMNFPHVAHLSVPNGVFFCGWLNWARGTYCALGLSDSFAKATENKFKNDCEKIAAAYKTSPTPYLESYSGMAWPSDNIVAIASLRMHDFISGKEYDSIIKNWIVEVKKRLDSETGMIPYEVDPYTGNSIEGAEANALAVILCYLAELDPEFAAQQYRLYSSTFPTDILGLYLIRHYPKAKGGFGNIDSGPVIFSIGSAATMVGSAPMRVFGDFSRAYRVEHSIDALGVPLTFGGKTRYALGLMPIADAFLVWSRLAHVYTQKIPVIKESKNHNLWHWKFHAYSLFIIALIWVPIIWMKIGDRKQKLADN